MIRFSLILGTVGRTGELERSLASLDAQSYRNFELIVVDQNPDERLAPILAPYKDRLSILHLRSEKGLSKAKNVGLKHVDGDIIGFPDDDCRYPPSSLARVARFFVEHPEIDGLTGRSIDEDGNTNMGRFDTESGTIDRLNVWRRGIAYNIFLRRESVRGIWFDEELGPGAGTEWGAGDETDYLLQLLSRGTLLYYEPDLVVVHPSPVPPYDAEAARRTYAYSCGIGHVFEKHKLPLWFKAKWLIRPLGGIALSLVGLKPREAEYRWNTFRGRLRGMRS